MGTLLQQNALAPPASHRPSLPVQSVQPVPQTVSEPAVQKQLEAASITSKVIAAPLPQISFE